MSETPSSLVALKHRNFRLLWGGQLVSTTGSMMQTYAILWHVSLLGADHKAIALGFVGLVRVLPIIFFSLVSGVVADALDRRKLMLLTQTAMTLTAGVLAFLTWRGHDSLAAVYLLAALSSAGSAFDGPARQALVPTLVPREHLPNALSLNTINFQAANVLGPALAGGVIAMGGVAFAYALNSLSFVAVIVALLLMRDVPTRQAVDRSPVSIGAAIEGLRFVFGKPLLRATILVDFFATFFSSATALLPIFAQDVLHVGEVGYGWLCAAPSVGALVASVLMVRLVDRLGHRGRTLLVSVVVYGLATIVFGFSRSFGLTFLCLAMTGAADTVSTVLRNVIRQLETPDHLRGRMTSVAMIFFMGGPQLGELEAGAVASLVGAPLSVVTGGIGCVLVTLLIAIRSPVLRDYRK